MPELAEVSYPSDEYMFQPVNLVNLRRDDQISKGGSLCCSCAIIIRYLHVHWQAVSADEA